MSRLKHLVTNTAKHNPAPIITSIHTIPTRMYGSSKYLQTKGSKRLFANDTNTNSIVPYSDEHFRKMKKTGDVYTDAIITEIFENNNYIGTPLSSLMYLRNNENIPEDAHIPPILQEYYHKPIEYPSWYNEQRVINGQIFASKHLVNILVSLLYHSLPFTYATNESKLLSLSENFTKNVNARSMRSLQFVRDVFKPYSLTLKYGHAIRTCQTIRLIHSSIRYHFGSHQLFQDKFGYVFLTFSPRFSSDLVTCTHT